MKSYRASLGDPAFFRMGFNQVRKRDARLGRVMDKHGVIEFSPEGEIFESLVESILSQQLASPAAGAIIKKVRALYPNGGLEAESMLRTPGGKLRAAGVSPQKIGYLRDLARRVVKGDIDLEALRQMEDEEIIKILDEVKGIGPWTIQMLLIFTLGRPNVLPVDDLGIRKGIQSVYSLAELPKRAHIERLAANWQPYCSVASLYLWRHKDGGEGL